MRGNNDTSVIRAMAAGGVPGGGENPMLSDRNRAPYESLDMRGVIGQIAYIKGIVSSPYKRTSVRGCNPRNILSEYGSEERGKSFDAVFTILLWMLRYRSRECFSKREK